MEDIDKKGKKNHLLGGVPVKKKKIVKDSLDKRLTQAEGKHVLSHGKGFPIAKYLTPKGNGDGLGSFHRISEVLEITVGSRF